MIKKKVSRLTGLPLHQLKRWRGDLLKVGLYENGSTYKGSEGLTGTLYRKTGEPLPLAAGGWYKEGSKILLDDRPLPLPLAVLEVAPAPRDILVLRCWKDWKEEAHQIFYYVVLSEDLIDSFEEWFSSYEEEENRLLEGI